MTDEIQYLELLEELYEGANTGEFKLKGDRTGTGTYSTIGGQMKFDLSKGFPLLTSKKVFMRMIIHELLWFIKGDTNIKYLVDNNVHIWDAWAYERYVKDRRQIPANDTMDYQSFIKIIKSEPKDSIFVKGYGELGPIYGKQWRDFNGQGVDQLQNAIDTIKKNPNSRRIIINAWNPVQLSEMALTPCHAFFQFVVNDGKLSCHLYQRSADMFLGVPFNIASYALLTHMVAQITGLEVGYFVHSFGDRHIYSNHMGAISKQLKNKDKLFEFPKLELNKDIKEINDFKFEDIKIVDYKSHGVIKAPVAV